MSALFELINIAKGAWTGLEYPFAGQCLYAGLNEIALQGVCKSGKLNASTNVMVCFSVGNFSLD